MALGSAVLLAHLGLLAGLTGPSAGGRPSAADRLTAQADGAAQAGRVTVVRSVERSVVRLQPLAEAAPADRAPAPDGSTTAAAQRAAAPGASEPARALPDTSATSGPGGPDVAIEAAVDARADAAVDPATEAPRSLPGGVDEEYLPRSALSLAPEALDEVLLAYPPEAPPGRYRGVLTLFIDAEGRVRRVRSEPAAGAGDSEALPPIFEDAARQAFLAARFRPGERDGRPVKSRIRIAVEFEAQAAPPSVEERGVR